MEVSIKQRLTVLRFLTSLYPQADCHIFASNAFVSELFLVLAKH